MTKNASIRVRLPEPVINKLKEFARAQYLPPRAMVIAWIMQRLEVEQSNIEPVPGVVTPMSAPSTDGHQTQGAGADGF